MLLGDHPKTASSLKELAKILIAMGQLTEATQLLEKVLYIQQSTRGNQNVMVAASLNNLGGVYWRMNRLEEALPLLEQSVGIYQKFPSDSPADYATALNTLATIYQIKNQSAEAAKMLEQTLQINQQMLEAHPFTVRSFNNLAVLDLELNRANEAEELLRKAVNMNQQVLGTTHPTAILTHNNLARLLMLKGDQADAFNSLRSAEKAVEDYVRYVLPGLTPTQISERLTRQPLVNGYLLSLCQLTNGADNDFCRAASAAIQRSKQFHRSKNGQSGEKWQKQYDPYPSFYIKCYSAHTKLL